MSLVSLPPPPIVIVVIPVSGSVMIRLSSRSDWLTWTITISPLFVIPSSPIEPVASCASEVDTYIRVFPSVVMYLLPTVAMLVVCHSGVPDANVAVLNTLSLSPVAIRVDIPCVLMSPSGDSMILFVITWVIASAPPLDSPLFCERKRK